MTDTERLNRIIDIVFTLEDDGWNDLKKGKKYTNRKEKSNN
jgi:hypothetical protein